MKRLAACLGARPVTAAAALLLVLALIAPSVAAPVRQGEGTEQLDGRAPTKEEFLPSVEAAFLSESYAPGDTAKLVFFNQSEGVRLQLFRTGPERTPTVGKDELEGVPVMDMTQIGRVIPGRTTAIRLGLWPSGLYFARLEAVDGRVGFAPFVLRPRKLGAHPVAVVMPTLTWQAYNLRDDDRDGVGDSGYADWNRHTVRLGRPFLNRGVPYNFRSYDLPFLHWLAQSGREVDLLSDADLDLSSATMLAHAYRLIVFPGHHEYVTAHEYDAVERYRDLGGHLAFLSANNFFWRVVRHGETIEKTSKWRELGATRGGADRRPVPRQRRR